MNLADAPYTVILEEKSHGTLLEEKGETPSSWAIEISDPTDFLEVFEAVQRLPKLDTTVQLCLGRLGQIDPLYVVDALEDRVRRHANAKVQGDPYGAIPHGAHIFADDLRSQPGYREALRRTRDWELSGEAALRAHAPYMLEALAGKLDEVLISLLTEWIESGDIQKQRAVARILKEFNEGEQFYALGRQHLLHSNDSSVREALSLAIQSTPGAILGSFSNFARKRKEEISPWLSDSDYRVRRFAQQVIRALQPMLQGEDSW